MGEPGTTNTSRPWSAAMRAVIREPERSAASMTTTPCDRPLTMRLRRGNARARGGAPRGNSASNRPRPAIFAVEPGVLRRVDLVDPAGQHGHGAGVQGSRMGGGVDAAGEPGGDDKARRPQREGELAGKAPAGREASRAPTTARVGRASRPVSPIADSIGGASGSDASAAG